MEQNRRGFLRSMLITGTNASRYILWVSQVEIWLTVLCPLDIQKMCLGIHCLEGWLVCWWGLKIGTCWYMDLLRLGAMGGECCLQPFPVWLIGNMHASKISFCSAASVRGKPCAGFFLFLDVRLAERCFSLPKSNGWSGSGAKHSSSFSRGWRPSEHDFGGHTQIWMFRI